MKKKALIGVIVIAVILCTTIVAFAGSKGLFKGMAVGTTTSPKLSFVKDTSSFSGNVLPGTTNVELAKFDVKSTSDSARLTKISLAIAHISGNNLLTGNVDIKFNGSIIWSGLASSISNNNANPLQITLTTQDAVVAVGTNSILTVEGNIKPEATYKDTYRVYLDLTEVKWLMTGNAEDPKVNQAAGNLIGVISGDLKVTTLTNPVVLSLVAGSQNNTLAKFEFSNPSTTEDVKLTQIVVTDKMGFAAKYSNLVYFNLYNSSNEILATTSLMTSKGKLTLSLSFPLIIGKKTSMALVLKGDVASGIGGSGVTHKLNVAAGSDVSAVGLITNTIVNASASGSGQPIVIVKK